MKNKIVSIVLMICMMVSLMPTVALAEDNLNGSIELQSEEWNYPSSLEGIIFKGDGTKDNPYQISSAQELAHVLCHQQPCF